MIAIVEMYSGDFEGPHKQPNYNIAQKIQRKKKIPANQICSAFYILFRIKTNGKLSVGLLSQSFSRPFFHLLWLYYLFMTATIEIQNKVQALNFQHITEWIFVGRVRVY